MVISFRPWLESLDRRDLPSVTPFTFVLADGTTGSGSFNYADAQVDPGQASQLVPISDLTMAFDGQSVALQQALTAPVAVFSLGLLRGVSFAGDLDGGFTNVSTVPGSVALALTPAGARSFPAIR